MLQGRGPSKICILNPHQLRNRRSFGLLRKSPSSQPPPAFESGQIYCGKSCRSAGIRRSQKIGTLLSANRSSRRIRVIICNFLRPTRVVLSHFCAVPSDCSDHRSFESDWTFLAQCPVTTPCIVRDVDVLDKHQLRASIRLPRPSFPQLVSFAEFILSRRRHQIVTRQQRATACNLDTGVGCYL